MAEAIILFQKTKISFKLLDSVDRVLSSPIKVSKGFTLNSCTYQTQGSNKPPSIFSGQSTSDWTMSI